MDAAPTCSGKENYYFAGKFKTPYNILYLTY
jgi:hypothetical protein